LDFYDAELADLYTISGGQRTNLMPEATMYPDGYGTSMITLDEMKAKHGPKMHPEFERRFFAYIAAHNGRLGVGGGWRHRSDISAASAAGKSFHQDQRYASGFVGYAAVDLVHVADGKHRAPTWAETADAPTWGLHTFIKVPNEPWHIQCVEMRGFDSWERAGRPDPELFPLPGTIPPPTPKADIDMIVIEWKPGTASYTGMISTGTQLGWLFDGNAAAVFADAKKTTVSDVQLTSLIKSSQTTTDPPPTLSSTDRALWTTRRG
jgi:hypothetical protein